MCGRRPFYVRAGSAQEASFAGIFAETHTRRFRSASGHSIRNAERCVIGICDHSSNGVRAPASLALLDVVNQRYRFFIGPRYFSKLHFFDLPKSNRLRSNLDSPHHCHVMQHSI